MTRLLLGIAVVLATLFRALLMVPMLSVQWAIALADAVYDWARDKSERNREP